MLHWSDNDVTCPSQEHEGKNTHLHPTPDFWKKWRLEMPPRQARRNNKQKEQAPANEESQENKENIEKINVTPNSNIQEVKEVIEIKKPLPRMMLPQPVADSKGRVPRLMIKQMVLENFKSYAGVRCIGPFHKSFSSIVGPNGSGKSNVFDAMLFVFGKRATKIRSKKLSELIHKSSAHPNLQLCKVTVYFHEIVDIEDSDDYEIIPNSDFTVTRTVDTASKTDYFVDGRRSNFTDVTTLLQSKGIDLENNRFLILQGEVEQIAMMQPKAANEHENGLLEYLEDIIGSNRFVEAIEQASKQVETLNELRQEKLNRVKLVEKEKDGLEGAKTEAEEYLKISHKLLLKRAQLFQLFESESRANEAETLAQMEELNKKLAHERAKMEERTEKLRSMEKEHKRKQDAFNKTRDQMQKCNDDFAMADRQDIQCREDIKHAKATEKKLTTKIKKDTTEVATLTESVESTDGKVAALEKSLEKITSRHAVEEKVLEQIFEKLQSETGHLRVQKEAKEKSLIPLKKKVNISKKSMDVATSEIDLLRNKTKNNRDAYDETKRQLAATQAELAVKGSDLKKNEKLLRLVSSNLQTSIEEQKALESSETALGAERKALLRKTEEVKDCLHKASNKDAVLDGLMNLRKNGTLPGIKVNIAILGFLHLFISYFVHFALTN